LRLHGLDLLEDGRLVELSKVVPAPSSSERALASLQLDEQTTHGKATPATPNRPAVVSDSPISQPHPSHPGDQPVIDNNQLSIVDKLEALLSRFLALNSGLPLVLALWCIATYLYEQFDAFPYLAITSPTKRCGKTRLCELLALVCFHPLQTVCISSAARYRLLRTAKRTLLIDEAEYLGRKNDERASTLREILNAGYRKGPSVVRCKQITTRKAKKDVTDYETEAFETYCPKALVLIGQLQETLADRCIEIRMERRTDKPLERFRLRRVQAEAAPQQQKLSAWAIYNAVAVQAYYQDNDLPFLSDREAELWQPLFSVCEKAAPHRVTELAATARRLADLKSQDESGDWGIQLLGDLRKLFFFEDGHDRPSGEVEGPLLGMSTRYISRSSSRFMNLRGQDGTRAPVSIFILSPGCFGPTGFTLRISVSERRLLRDTCGRVSRMLGDAISESATPLQPA